MSKTGIVCAYMLVPVIRKNDVYAKKVILVLADALTEKEAERIVSEWKNLYSDTPGIPSGICYEYVPQRLSM